MLTRHSLTGFQIIFIDKIFKNFYTFINNNYSRSISYVYAPNNGTYFQTLEQHCETSEFESKLPLVVLGDPGSGKSALLANWAKQRREIHHKNEYLFQYFVECSSESIQV